MIISSFTSFKGANIHSISLPWPPWLELFECKSNGEDCESKGTLKIIIDNIAGMFNFTWSVDSEPIGDWGMLPKGSGWSDKNARFTGIIGALVEKVYFQI